MVLKINNELIEDFSSFEDLLNNYPDLAETSINWKNSEIKTVYKHDRFVYIGQREMGILDTSDQNVNVIGSEDATTCHIVILKNLTTQSYGIIHIDSHRENQLEKLVLAMVQNYKTDSETSQNNLNTKFEVYIVGGYNDEKDTSRQITRTVMNYMISEQTKLFHLKLACAGFINTRTVENLENEILNYPAPIHYGVAVNGKSGLIFPAKFISHAPDKDIRMLKSNVVLVYNSKEGRICVPVFDYDSCSSAKLWIQVNDDIILNNLSTSPKVEPSHFCDDMRNMFKRMVTDPDPHETLFKNNSDRYYSLNKETLDWELDNPELYGSNHTKDKQQFSLTDFIRTAKKI